MGKAGRGGLAGGLLPRLGRHRAAGSDGDRRGAGKPSSNGRTRVKPLTAARVAAARRRIARDAARQKGPRLGEAIQSALAPSGGKRPSARQAWKAARSGVTGPNPKRRGAFRRAAAGLVAAGTAAAVAAWRNRRHRKAIAKARAAKAAQIAARKHKRVARNVPPPAGGGRTQHKKVPAPTPARQPGGKTMPPRAKTTAAPAAGTANGVGAAALIAASEQFLDAALNSVPDPKNDGMLAVVADMHAFPSVLENIAKAMKVRYDAVQQLPISPAIKELCAAIHIASVAMQESAAQMVDMTETIHRDKLDELRNPTQNAQMWDQRVNQGA